MGSAAQTERAPLPLRPPRQHMALQSKAANSRSRCAFCRPVVTQASPLPNARHATRQARRRAGSAALRARSRSRARGGTPRTWRRLSRCTADLPPSSALLTSALPRRVIRIRPALCRAPADGRLPWPRSRSRRCRTACRAAVASAARASCSTAAVAEGRGGGE